MRRNLTLSNPLYGWHVSYSNLCSSGFMCCSDQPDTDPYLPVEPGFTYSVNWPSRISLCEWGLHAAPAMGWVVQPRYVQKARGDSKTYLHLVALHGFMSYGYRNDPGGRSWTLTRWPKNCTKMAAQHRTVIASLQLGDGTDIPWRFTYTARVKDFIQCPRLILCTWDPTWSLKHMKRAAPILERDMR